MVKNGKLSDQAGKNIAQVIRQMEGKHLLITIAEQKRPRSNNQNRYYWGVVVRYVLQMFLDAGNTIDVMQVHEYLKEHVGGLTDIIIDPAGKRRPITRSSTRLTTQEFEEYAEKIRAWAAEFGMIIPLPNEETDGDAYFGEF